MSDHEDDQEAAGQLDPQAHVAGGGPTQHHYRPSIRAPGPVDVTGDDKKVNWELHKQMWQNYSIASHLEHQHLRVQRAELLNSLGRDTLRVYNGLGGAPEDTVEEIIAKLDEFCIGQTNEAVAHYLFSTRDQRQDESFDAWMSELRTKQKGITYTHTTMTVEQLALRNKVICGVLDKDAQQKMLDEGNPDLNRVIEIARASEATRQYMKTIRSTTEIHKVSHRFEEPHQRGGESDRREASHRKPDRQKHKPPQKGRQQREVECMYCKYSHVMVKEKCPAYGKRCDACKKFNHFKGSRKCERQSVHTVDEYTSEYSESTDDEFIGKVDSSMETSTTQSVYCEMLVWDGQGYTSPVKLQIDCGATVNVIPRRHVPETVQLLETTVTLSMWNKTAVTPLGECVLKLKNPKTGRKHNVRFIVVSEKLRPLLSRQAAEKMGLITINYAMFKAVNAVTGVTPGDNPIVFDGGLGKMPGTVHLVVRDDITATVCPPRKVPVSIRDKVKEKLEDMELKGIIEKMDEPSDWVSQMAVTVKKNGDLRICIDPRPLNKALKREHYPMPVLDDILPDLSKARVFSRLDLQDGYWHCELDEESSKLTTFQTHIGRYRWKRLPFGLNVSAEIFQKRLKTTLEGLESTECIVDDILVWGVGDSMEEAHKDHNKNLNALMARGEEHGLKFKLSKCEFRTTSTVFQGHIITDAGLQVDPAKIKAIQSLEPPKNVEAVRVFRGTVNYLARFLPQLSTVMEPINRLTKEDVPWHWEHEQDQALKKIKDMICSAPVMAYYDPQKELVLQCDASESGLGAALLQDGRPIAYASRALTDPETRYAQIEKEAVAVAWSLEHFRQYTYGRKTIVHTDHKPLEPIAKKPLCKAPRRLQGIFMRILEFDIDLLWRPGKEMHVADMLSRSYLPTSTGMPDIEKVCMVDYLPIRTERLQQLKLETEKDEPLQILRTVILKGWPGEKHQCPTQITPYFSIRDELSIQDGLIFRGERVVIPASMRDQMKKAIHTSHLGEESCLRRAREALYWPGMNAEIKTFISACDACRTYETSQCKETMMPHELSDRPWKRVAIDLFTWEDKDYLVTSDYYSNYWEVDKLKKTNSATIIGKLKRQFAGHGIPEQVISDNAANLTSDEFEEFAKDWDFEHITVSPYNSKANGKAESSVKAAKRMLRKTKKSGTDPYLALLEIRNTPTQGIGSSPMQRLNNRRARTLLPMTPNLLKPRVINLETEREQLQHQKNRQVKYFNRHATDLPALEEGDTVRMKPFIKGQREWKKAVVVNRLDERSYTVDTPDGSYRRNRADIRRTKEVPPPTIMQRKSYHIPPKKTNAGELVSTPATHKKPTNTVPSTAPRDESGAHSPTKQLVCGPRTPPSPPVPAQNIPSTTRSGRIVKKPLYLSNYVP